MLHDSTVCLKVNAALETGDPQGRTPRLLHHRPAPGPLWPHSTELSKSEPVLPHLCSHIF